MKKIIVKDKEISISGIEDNDYISLTDIARIDLKYLLLMELGLILYNIGGVFLIFHISYKKNYESFFLIIFSLFY